jgi:hypothetical protein
MLFTPKIDPSGLLAIAYLEYMNTYHGTHNITVCGIVIYIKVGLATFPLLPTLHIEGNVGLGTKSLSQTIVL